MTHLLSLVFGRSFSPELSGGATPSSPAGPPFADFIGPPGVPGAALSADLPNERAPIAARGATKAIHLLSGEALTLPAPGPDASPAAELTDTIQVPVIGLEAEAPKAAPLSTGIEESSSVIEPTLSSPLAPEAEPREPPARLRPRAASTDIGRAEHAPRAANPAPRPPAGEPDVVRIAQTNPSAEGDAEIPEGDIPVEPPVPAERQAETSPQQPVAVTIRGEMIARAIPAAHRSVAPAVSQDEEPSVASADTSAPIERARGPRHDVAAPAARRSPFGGEPMAPTRESPDFARHLAAQGAEPVNAPGDLSGAMGDPTVAPRPDLARPAVQPGGMSAPAPGTVSARPGEIGRQLGVEIARHNGEGRDSMTIRLDPVELGRIQIRMHFDEGGTLRAHVSAESGAALEMLRRDSGDLTRALGDAGVRTDAQSFQFDTRGQQREQSGQRPQPEWAQQQQRPDSSATPIQNESQPVRRKLNPHGALDLFA